MFVGGEYLGYRVFTNYNQGGFVGLVGLLAVIITLIGIALILEIPFSYLNEFYYKYVENNKTLANIICIPMFILTIGFFAIPTIVFYHYSDKYHQEQLDSFGVTQDIIIDSESHGKNSNNYSYFNFFHNGIEWRKSLRIWHYGIGDTAKIIYSKENPNEVEWYEKYLEKKINKESSQIFTATNIGFCASGADGITIGFLLFIVLQFGLDKHR